MLGVVLLSGNPDGEAALTHANAEGVAVHRAFPVPGSDEFSDRVPVVKRLLNEVQSRQANRAIHLRTSAAGQ